MVATGRLGVVGNLVAAANTLAGNILAAVLGTLAVDSPTAIARYLVLVLGRPQQLSLRLLLFVDLARHSVAPPIEVLLVSLGQLPAELIAFRLHGGQLL